MCCKSMVSGDSYYDNFFAVLSGSIGKRDVNAIQKNTKKPFPNE